jgi:hypothetical protein
MVFGRLSRLLQSASASTPTPSPHLLEAQQLASGTEPWCEAQSNLLVVPRNWPVAEVEVRKVWEELLKATDEADWQKLHEEGQMQWRCFPGMVRLRLSM